MSSKLIVKSHPLNYQLQDNSCWATSMINAAFVCSRNTRGNTVIPNSFVSLLFNLTTDEGVYNIAAEAFYVIFKNENKTRKILNNIGCSKLSGEKVTSRVFQNFFKNYKKCAIVCDVQSGCHSVLITNYNDGYFWLFDPSWDNIKTPKKTLNWSCDPEWVYDSVQHNVKVKSTTLFGGNSNLYSMGIDKHKFALVFFRIP